MAAAIIGRYWRNVSSPYGANLRTQEMYDIVICNYASTHSFNLFPFKISTYFNMKHF